MTQSWLKPWIGSLWFVLKNTAQTLLSQCFYTKITNEWVTLQQTSYMQHPIQKKVEWHLRLVTWRLQTWTLCQVTPVEVIALLAYIPGINREHLVPRVSLGARPRVSEESPSTCLHQGVVRSETLGMRLKQERATAGLTDAKEKGCVLWVLGFSYSE